MNTQVFKNNQFGEVRVATNGNGEPLFCLMDLCQALNLSNPTIVANRLDGDELTKLNLGGRKGEVNFVTELGMYNVIIRSDSPIAKPMTRWITHEVLPSIRKHGMYAKDELLENPDLLIEVATALKIEKQKRIEAEKQIKTLQPKAELMDKVLDTDEKIDIGQATKILELPFGRNTLFKKLREKGVFFKNRNEPRQDFVKRGYFVLKEKFIERNNHDGFVVIKVLVMQKRLEYISNLFNAATAQKQIAAFA